MLITHLVCKVGVWHWAAPLQVAGDAAGLEAVAEPGAGDLLSVGRPVAGTSRLVQPLLQLTLQLTSGRGRRTRKTRREQYRLQV